MKQLFINNVSIGQTRREVHDGRSYLVADSTIIVPGVLPGSKGALYYPPDEVSQNPSKWNGVLVTVNHPYDPVTGEPLSALDSGVKQRQGIGVIKNSKYKGKLKTEVWFDEDRTKKIDNRIYHKLINNQPIELSTGLFTDNFQAPAGSKDPVSGRAYDMIARNYRPDHLAILPDQTGACSLNDGCGVLVNSNTLVTNQAMDTVELLRQQNLNLAINAISQGRHPTTGKFQPTAPAQAKRGHQQTGWETADKELHEDDADAELIGENKPGEDGRQLTTPVNPSNKGITEWDTPDSSLDKAHTEETTEEEEKKTPQGKNKVKKPADGKRIDNSDLLTNSELGTNAEFESDEQRMAFFGKLISGDIKGSSKGKDNKDEQNKAMEKSQTAAKRTALVKKAGGAERRAKENGKAAVAHREAAEAHSSLHEKTGDKYHKDMTDAHTKFANEHEAASRQSATHNQQHWNRFYIYNAKWTQKKRDKLDTKDFAGPNQSFPIKDQSDVKDAFDLRGHADNPKAVGDKVKAIAQRKGFKVPKGESDTTTSNWEVSEQKDIDDDKLTKKNKTNNSFQESPTFYNYGNRPNAQESGTSMYGPTAHDTSMQAAHASLGTEHGPAIKFANKAVEHSGNDNPGKAAAAHGMAADEHEKEALNCMTKNDMEGAQNNTDAASQHRMAMTHQKSCMTQNYGPRELSGDERKAAFAAMAESGEEKSGSAAEASKKANKSKDSEDHTDAASAHKEAASHFKKSGDTKMAKVHSALAKEHSAKSKSTNNRRPIVIGTRENALKILVANCKCDDEKAALNELDTKTLFKLALNKKAEGSNADVTDGEGSMQVGGEEDNEENKDADEFEDKAKAGAKVKKTTLNAKEWLDSAPVEMQEIWNNAVLAENQTRKNLANRIVANVADKDQKTAMLKEFMNPKKHTLNSLKNLLSCIPTNNRSNNLSEFEGLPLIGANTLPNFLGAQGGDIQTVNTNISQDENDILPVVTLNYAELVEEQRTGKKTG